MDRQFAARLTAGLIFCSPMWAGCNWLTPLAMLAPEPTEKVPPEFDRLAGHKVVILVWAPPETLFDYPKVRFEVASYVGDQIKSKVRDVELVHPRLIEQYIEKAGPFEQDPVEISRHFGAEIVVHLELVQFSMRDMEMAHFYRGRIHAGVTIYDMTKGGAEPETFTLQEAVVVYPKERAASVYGRSPDVVRQQTYEAFADTVAKKFYEYERPL